MNEEPNGTMEEPNESNVRSTAIAHKSDAAFEREICNSRKLDADQKATEALKVWLRAHKYMNEAKFHECMDLGNSYRDAGARFYVDAAQMDERADNYFNQGEELWDSPDSYSFFERAATIYEICGSTFRHSGDNYVSAFGKFQEALELCQAHDMENIA